MLGLQHALSARQHPVPLAVVLPAMMLPGLLVTGPVEGAYTLVALSLLRKANLRGVALGFPFLTTGLVLGALWARVAWGSAFSYDPLAFLSFVAWLIYAGTLAGRAAPGWHGRRAAYFSIIGFVALVATLGAGLFLPGRPGS